MVRQRIRSTKHARRRQEARKRRWRFYSTATVVGLVLLVGITHLPALQIQSISVEAGEYADADLIKGFVENILSEPALGVMSRKNIILAPRDEISAKVQEVSPQIKEVDIDITGLRSLRIETMARQPVAEVCRQPTGRQLQGCHFIDAESIIFIRADEAATTTSGLTYVVDAGLRQRERLLPSEDFRDLHSFIQALDEIDLSAELAYLEEYGDVIIPVEDATGEEAGSVNLQINLYDDLSQVLANLQTVLENDSFVASTPINGETPETVSPFSLEYIDLRFENKVFYK